jgi:hypothetical protein
MPSKRVRDPRRIPTKWRIIQQIEGMTKAVTIHPLDADGKILPGLTISRISRKGELGDREGFLETLRAERLSLSSSPNFHLVKKTERIS